MSAETSQFPASVSPYISYTWTLIFQDPSSLRFQDSKWSREDQGDGSCPLPDTWGPARAWHVGWLQSEQG